MMRKQTYSQQVIKVDKWQMYLKIKQFSEDGFSERNIAKQLGISRTTVTKYLKKDAEEMSVWMASTKNRKKKLDAIRQRY